MENRHLHTRVKTAKGRKKSSIQWLQRQLNDPYVAEAHRQGYRGRAAFKIIDMNNQFHFFKKGCRVVDLGCAPGGWTQVATNIVGSTEENPLVFGLDILPTPPIVGAKLLQMDFLAEQAPEELKKIMNGKADVVVSDMAANTTGVPSIDHLRIMNLVELAYDFAKQVLNPNGWFIAKIFAGGTEQKLLAQMKKDFDVVKHVKPPSSRKDSVEFYVVAKGFKCGRNK